MAATSNDSGSALQALQRCGARPQAEGQHHRYLQSRDVTLTSTMTHSPFSTTMMTLPRALPRSRYRKASAVSLSGYVRSMRGVTRPALINSLRVIKWSWFGVETNGRSCWRTNSELAQVLEQVIEMVADSRNQPPFDTARTDDELLKARDGCVSPRTRRWPGATR
jgi:hypothetical protein